MKKNVADRLRFLLGSLLIFLLCAVVLFPIKAKAEETRFSDDPNYEEEYDFNYHFDLNKEYDLTIKPDSRYIFSWGSKEFQLEKAFYKITIQTYNHKLEDVLLLTSNDPVTLDTEQCYTEEDFKVSYDKKTKIYTYTFGLTSDTIIDWLEWDNDSSSAYRFKIKITGEPAIVLSQTAISGITNTKQRTMTVKYAPVKKRLGYQIEYATDNKFKDKQRVNTGATTKDVGKLTKGKTYYVRVRSYARYSDGTLVYSKWSGTRKIKIKK